MLGTASDPLGRAMLLRADSGHRVMERRTFLGVIAGGLLAAPLAAEAQPAGKVYRVCFLALTPGEDTTSMQPLLERLHELGYGEGKNMAFEYRSAEGHPERLSQMARELVRDSHGTGGESRHHHHPDRVHDRRRSGRCRAGRQPRPARGERHRPERRDSDWGQATTTLERAQIGRAH